MSNFFSNLFRHEPGYAGPEKMDRAYVSEFTQFIDQFVEEHPEVVEDQRVGRALYWDKKLDLAEQEKAEQAEEPGDGYGFYASAWTGKDKGTQGH